VGFILEPSDEASRPAARRLNGPRILRLKQKAARLPVLSQIVRARRLLRIRKARAEATPPICDSVLDWAVEHRTTRYWRLAPPERIAYHPPRTVEAQVHRQFVQVPELRVAESYLVELEGARLEIAKSDRSANACPRLVLPDGSVSSESTYGHVKQCLPNLVELGTPMDGDFFSLMSPYASYGNYYHWLHDVLVSLYGVCPHLPSSTRFIVAPDPWPVYLESLAMVGIAPERLITFDPRSGERPAPGWRLERLWYSPGPIGGLPKVFLGASPRALAWLRDAGLALLESPPRTAHRLLYISRRQAPSRRVVNEDEVMTYLADHGFELHTLEDYSLREQIALFAEAKVVMGPHGAGHTNMIFSPKGLVIVDILTSEVNPCFHNMSLTIGHQYWYMFGDDVPRPSRDVAARSKFEDIYVPLDKLARVTSLVLEAAMR
jgi:hypothetical protein